MRALSPRVLAPLLVTALTALTPAACASSSRPAAAACTPADLRVSAAYSQSATQHAIYGLTFTNVSRTACKLQGYPGVSLVTAGNSAGRPIRSSRPLIMHSRGPVKTVTLAPGRHALALMGVAETVMFTGASCNPAAAHWLSVYPPCLHHAVYLPVQALTCSSSRDQVLEIGPVYPDSRTTACPRSRPIPARAKRIRPGQNNARPQRHERAFVAAWQSPGFRELLARGVSPAALAALACCPLYLRPHRDESVAEGRLPQGRVISRAHQAGDLRLALPRAGDHRG